MAALAKVAPILSSIGNAGKNLSQPTAGGNPSVLSKLFGAHNSVTGSGNPSGASLGNFADMLNASSDTSPSATMPTLGAGSNTLSGLSSGGALRPTVTQTQPDFGQSRYVNRLRG